MTMDTWTGKSGDYHWLVTNKQVWSLGEIVKSYHEKEFLHITACDSGPITPTDGEKASGWTQDGKIMISPPLYDQAEIPHEQFDEWYISSVKLSFPDELEIFVNYCGFTLVSPHALTKDDDPSWERGRFDYLYALHERFWSQLTVVNPDTYVSSGDLDIVVSKKKRLLDEIAKAHKLE